MAERSSDEAEVHASRGEAFVDERNRWWRLASFVALGLIAALIVIIAVVWIERRPIATHYLKGEFQRRGVQASYHLDRVGLRTQEVHDLVIGDPKRPDLTARHAIIQMRLKWDGSFEVFRVFARGVRLRGRLIHGKVSWGQIDKLLPPPLDSPAITNTSCPCWAIKLSTRSSAPTRSARSTTTLFFGAAGMTRT